MKTRIHQPVRCKFQPTRRSPFSTPCQGPFELKPSPLLVKAQPNSQSTIGENHSSPILFSIITQTHTQIHSPSRARLLRRPFFFFGGNAGSRCCLAEIAAAIERRSLSLPFVQQPQSENLIRGPQIFRNRISVLPPLSPAFFSSVGGRGATSPSGAAAAMAGVQRRRRGVQRCRRSCCIKAATAAAALPPFRDTCSRRRRPCCSTTVVSPTTLPPTSFFSRGCCSNMGLHLIEPFSNATVDSAAAPRLLQSFRQYNEGTNLLVSVTLLQSPINPPYEEDVKW